MPIYEYECEAGCGAFEMLRPLMDFDELGLCPECGGVGERLVSRVTMRPDTMWAGQVDSNYGYFTSSAKLKAEMKRRNHVRVGDRTDREGMDKVAEQGAKNKEEKLNKEIRGWSERTFGPSGLGLGGADGEKLIRESK